MGVNPAAGCRGQQYARANASVNNFGRERNGRQGIFREIRDSKGVEGIFGPAMEAPSGPPHAAKQAHFAAGRPLTPFEQLMLGDDRPGHPMCFFLECMIDGPLQENRLRATVEKASRRHPLLRCRIGFRGSRPVWIDADVQPTVIWNPSPTDADPWRPFDLRRESGLRVVVLSEGEQRHRVIFQVHHATCDGVAGCEFAGDIWALYAGIEPRAFSEPAAPQSGRTATSAPELPPADGGRDTARQARAFASFWPTALAPVTTGSEQCAAGHPPPAGGTSDPRSPPYMWIEFTPASSEQLRTAASADGVSLNDCVIAAAMRAALAWNSRAGRAPGNVRVTMPVNLRQPGERAPATNNLGYAFLDRTAAQCADPRSLRASVAAATRWILDHNAAAFFLGAIHSLTRWPWLLAVATRLPLCVSTVVVSNIGDPSRRMRSGVGKVDGRDAPGDLVIHRFLGVPPLRPRTRAAIGVTTYAGRLALCCICSAHPNPHEGGRLFLDLVRQELEKMTATGTTTVRSAHVTTPGRQA